MDFLSDRTGVNFFLDRWALEEEGITSQTPLTIHVEDLPPKTALRFLLDQLNLDYGVRDDVVVVTTATKLGERLRPRLYPIQDVASDEKEAEAWIEAIQHTVQPNSWNEVGGAGSIEFFAPTKCLVVDQTQVVHEELSLALAYLREPTKPGPTAGAGQIIRERLAKPVSPNFRDRPFSQVLEFLHRETGLNLVVDRSALEEEGITTDTPLTIQLEETPAATVLSHVFKHFEALSQAGLTYVIEDDVVLITARPGAEPRVSWRLHAIRDLASTPNEAAELIDTIRRTVAPESWWEGGACNIAFFGPTHCLIVTQTDEIHERIEAVLAELRKSRPMTGKQNK